MGGQRLVIFDGNHSLGIEIYRKQGECLQKTFASHLGYKFIFKYPIL